MITKKLISKQDGLSLEIAIQETSKQPKGIVQISHGMAEHKERYYEFMKFLSENGYISVIHDHRGHGASIKEKEDLGYFYTENINYIVEDLKQVTDFIKEKYKDLPVILFSHSMGTLVARNYLKKYDDQIEKVILCGPPTKNNLASIGILIAKISKAFGKDTKRNKFLDKLTFGNYNKRNKIKNEWICSNIKVVEEYNSDNLCGYIFTTNGFINLFKLMKEAFKIKSWKVENSQIDIFVIAGEDDPVIQSKKKFEELIRFLKNVGYKNIKYKLYPNKRHELLNEIGKENVYKDVFDFIKK